MLDPQIMLLGITGEGLALIVGVFFIVVFGLITVFFAFRYGKLWFQAWMSGADISPPSLIRMHFCKVHAPTIVQAKIMATQAGLDINVRKGISARRLEAHYLAGGTLLNANTFLRGI